MSEIFIESSTVAFSWDDSNNKLFRLEGDKRVPIELTPRSFDMISRALPISEERAMDLAHELAEDFAEERASELAGSDMPDKKIPLHLSNSEKITTKTSDEPKKPTTEEPPKKKLKSTLDKANRSINRGLSRIHLPKETLIKPTETSKPKKKLKDIDKEVLPTIEEGQSTMHIRRLNKRKLSGTQPNASVDPEILMAGIELGGYHVEAGASSFNAFSAKMLSDLGSTIKPYLKMIYSAVRDYPEFDNKGMDTSSNVENIIEAASKEAFNEDNQRGSHVQDRQYKEEMVTAAKKTKDSTAKMMNALKNINAILGETGNVSTEKIDGNIYKEKQMNPIIFRSDTTFKWPCRTGDYMIWCHFNGMFSAEDSQYTVNDLWQLKDGDSVTLTNRQPDLPSWFELHPLEVSNTLVYWMKKKLDSGWESNDIIEGSNLWRVMAGDRIVWVGKPRPGVESDNEILSIVTFDANALIVGEPYFEYDGLPHFGGFDQEEQSREDLLRCRNGWLAVSELGMPRSIDADYKWTIG